MSELRILHVIPNLLKGGAQRLVLDICNELRERKDVKVKLIVFDNSNEFKHISGDIDIQICNSFVLPSIFKKDQIDISIYEKAVDDFNPHVIHSHLYLAEIVTRENVRPNISYFTHCHDNIIQLNKFSFSSLFSKKKLTDFYERNRILKKYKECNNSFIAISKDTQSFLNGVLPAMFKRNITLLFNAIKIKTFINNKKTDYLDEIKLINVGNLMDKKNQVFLLEVVNYIKKNGFKVHLNLVGDGENKVRILEKTKKLGLENEVTLLGSIDFVEEYLWKSNIYVHSALYEPFGLVLLEAMAANLPVVSLNGNGNLDVIKNDENGFIINERDPIVFGKKIIQLFSDKKLYDRIVKAGFNHSKQFDISIYIDKLLLLYHKTLT